MINSAIRVRRLVPVLAMLGTIASCSWAPSPHSGSGQTDPQKPAPATPPLPPAPQELATDSFSGVDPSSLLPLVGKNGLTYALGFNLSWIPQQGHQPSTIAYDAAVGGIPLTPGLQITNSTPDPALPSDEIVGFSGEACRQSVPFIYVKGHKSDPSTYGLNDKIFYHGATDVEIGAFGVTGSDGYHPYLCSGPYKAVCALEIKILLDKSRPWSTVEPNSKIPALAPTATLSLINSTEAPVVWTDNNNYRPKQ